MNTLDGLKKLKEFLTWGRWSPNGIGDCINTFCIYNATYHFDKGGDPYSHLDQSLIEASKRLYNFEFLSDINDGRYRFEGTPAIERFEVLHKIIDNAIKHEETAPI